jgi:hypothetical protein
MFHGGDADPWSYAGCNLFATFDTETAQALSQPLDFAVNVQ